MQGAISFLKCSPSKHNYHETINVIGNHLILTKKIQIFEYRRFNGRLCKVYLLVLDPATCALLWIYYLLRNNQLNNTGPGYLFMNGEV
ncbi:hypothetical protein CS542_08990 [Pedobacter sp. IW39]|nr:hypothetical protein CS542_08990 [Pedobacter sp. IW39]